VRGGHVGKHNRPAPARGERQQATLEDRDPRGVINRNKRAADLERDYDTLAITSISFHSTVRGGRSHSYGTGARGTNPMPAIGRQSEHSWVAPFRLQDSVATKDAPFRVHHGEIAIDDGRIRRDPTDKDEIVWPRSPATATITTGSSRSWSVPSRRRTPTFCSFPATKCMTHEPPRGSAAFLGSRMTNGPGFARPCAFRAT